MFEIPLCESVMFHRVAQDVLYEYASSHVFITPAPGVLLYTTDKVLSRLVWTVIWLERWQRPSTTRYRLSRSYDLRDKSRRSILLILGWYPVLVEEVLASRAVDCV